MLPALNQRELASLGTHEFNKLKDQLDFAERDIEEEKRERARMKEQLSIQNDIISRIYTRLNQIEDQQAEESKTLGKFLNDAVRQQQQITDNKRQVRLEKSTATELETIKDKFGSFSSSVKEETEALRQLNLQLRDDVNKAQNYISTLYNNEQGTSGRLSKLETSTTAAMECIRSLQSVSNNMETKLKRRAEDTIVHEIEITNSLQQMGDCLNSAQSERNDLNEKISHSAEQLKAMLSELEHDLTNKVQTGVKASVERETGVLQSIDGISKSVAAVESRIVDEIVLAGEESKSLIGAVRGSVLQERSVRVQSEHVLRREMANVVNNLRENLTEHLVHSINAYQKDREKIQRSMKQLNESISIIEKSNEATRHGLEQIIQAEIRSRVSHFKTMEDTITTTQTALGAVDTRREQEFVRLKSEVSEQLEGELEKTRELLGVVESGISEMRSVVNTLQAEVTMTGNSVQECREEMETLIKQASETLFSDMDNKVDAISTQVGDMLKSNTEHVTTMTQNTSELADKLYEECDARKKDLIEVGKTLETKVDKVLYQGELNMLTQSMSETGDKLTALEDLVDKTTHTDKDGMDVLHAEVYQLHKMIDSIKVHDLESLKRDIERLYESYSDKYPLQTEVPQTPEKTLSSSVANQVGNTFHDGDVMARLADHVTDLPDTDILPNEQPDNSTPVHQLASPSQKPTSPAQKPTTPAQKPTTPARKLVSPKNSNSPTPKQSNRNSPSGSRSIRGIPQSKIKRPTSKPSAADDDF